MIKRYGTALSGLGAALGILLLSGCQMLPPNSAATSNGAQQPVTTQPSKPQVSQCKPEIKTVVKRIVVKEPVNVAGKRIFGAVEDVTFPALQLTVPARIDTGATSTSIHAEDVQEFERDGNPWVRFKVPVTEKDVREYEFPRARTVRIKHKGGGFDRRYVIQLRVNIGGLSHKVDVTLADRENFEYPALIGRNFLRDVAIVDVSHEFVAAERQVPEQTKEPRS